MVDKSFGSRAQGVITRIPSHPTASGSELWMSVQALPIVIRPLQWCLHRSCYRECNPGVTCEGPDYNVRD